MRESSAMASAPIGAPFGASHEPTQFTQLDDLGRLQLRTLRAYTGVAPVTKRSGKRLRTTHMRYACNPALAQGAVSLGSNEYSARRTRARLLRQPAHTGPSPRAGPPQCGGPMAAILIAMLRNRILYTPDLASQVRA